jgi:hypothetical protein
MRPASFTQAVALARPLRARPLICGRRGAFTFLITPEYKFSDDEMAYARVASGYRPGGPNYTIAPGYQRTVGLAAKF